MSAEVDADEQLMHAWNSLRELTLTETSGVDFIPLIETLHQYFYSFGDAAMRERDGLKRKVMSDLQQSLLKFVRAIHDKSLVLNTRGNRMGA